MNHGLVGAGDDQMELLLIGLWDSAEWNRYYFQGSDAFVFVIVFDFVMVMLVLMSMS